MKYNVHRIYLYILSLIVCLAFLGCGQKSQTDLNSQNIIMSQKTNSVIDESISPTPTIAATKLDTSVKNSTYTKIVKDLVTVKSETSVIFKNVSETVYTTANVNIRSSCTTAKDNVITVLKKGSSIKRIGVQSEWSKVLYNGKTGYIVTKYLTKVKPVADVSPFTYDKLIKDLKVTTKTNQLILVIGNSNKSSTVTFHVKDGKGKWHQQFSVVGDIGSNSITYSKREGDRKTPAGLYSFNFAFGIKKNPGSKMTYRQITKYDYWVDDVKSPYYNTWVNSKGTPGNFTSEHLIKHNPSYNYALSIKYNPDNTPGMGSAIFLHGYNGTGHTTGCIAIPENDVKTLVQAVNSSAKILIVPSSKDLAKY